MVITPGGRAAYVVVVEAFLYRDEKWLLIRRSLTEAHGAGALSGIGGKVEYAGADLPGVLEDALRREVLEEVGVDLTGVRFHYVGSSFFTSDDGDPMISAEFTAPIPADAEPYPAAPDEVDAVFWLTLDEAVANPDCPPWIRRSLRESAAVVAAGRGLGPGAADRQL